MGLASFFLGDQNPFTQWVNQNGNMLSTIGTGLMQGQNLQHGLQIAGGSLPQAKQMDLQQAEKLKAEKLAESQLNATLAWMERDAPELAMQVKNGILKPGEAFQLYWQQKNDQPDIPAPPSGYIWANPDRTELAPIKGGPADKPPQTAEAWGSSLEGRAIAILSNPNVDKNSADYKWAYWILSQPKPTMVQTQQGMVPIMTTPSLPPDVISPYPAQASAVSENATAPAPPSPTSPGISVGQPIPGTAPKPNEQDQRLARLSTAIETDANTLFGSGANGKGLFDALSDPLSQIAATSIGGAQPGFALSSADYQQAANAISNIAQTYLYAMSGAAAPAAEVDRIVQSVTPRFGESPESVKAKKQRLLDYIRAIRSRADGGVPAPTLPTNGDSGGFKIIGVE